MVVAPGLKKRGKSTGENFEIENLLVEDASVFVTGSLWDLIDL
jgi:hypothetical protein